MGLFSHRLLFVWWLWMESGTSFFLRAGRPATSGRWEAFTLQLSGRQCALAFLPPLTSRALAALGSNFDGSEIDDGEESDGEIDEISTSMSTSEPTSESLPAFKGKHRRALRALAGRKKANKSLFTMQQSESPPIEGFCIEVESALRAHELVNVRVLFAQKKKEAKAVGLLMAEAVKAELVQVIGHTYLLYRPADPPKIDLAKLTTPLNGKE